ncbi:uncharacterized protein Pkcdelta isoform X2 [Battus philenor]|uniref:uncharacterized protein Pkcdelta isoform X2 n=1 Tax=Battus philenor TaxID=42288 RepID=UPI0035CF2E7C
MPLFSEHISNMYYSGSPSYITSPYSYSSTFTPLGTSYSASYLNPGGSYSNHSSLGGYSRTPITSRWIPSGRSYSPILSTISERGTSSPIRINSPRRAPIQNRSNRTYVSATYTPRPVNINTADIDVSRDKYRNKTTSTPEESTTQTQKENLNVHEDKCPLTPRIEEKPETGIDSSPGNQRGVIKRDRTVVRLHTLKRKERDSPRKPVEDLQNKEYNNKTETQDIAPESKEQTTQTKKWREKLSDDLIYKDTREKKTLGEKLVEKFQVKNKDTDEINVDSNTPVIQQNIKISNKSPDRRCSMEMLAEQACLLDSLIRKENLSTATLDLSKIGTNKINSDNTNSLERDSSDVPQVSDQKSIPLTTTKSDHSLHSRLNNVKDQKLSSKRRSIKKSSSGSSISKLDSIIEFPKDLKEKTLPAIEESRQSSKSEKVDEQKLKTKTPVKTKITSTVEVTPPSSPLRFKVENITVEEKPRSPKKEITFSSEVVNEDNFGGIKNRNISTDIKRNIQDQINDPASPEPEDGNFWNKIGKRETVYLMTRKEKLDKARENQKRSLFWYPEEECDKNVNIDNIINNNKLNDNNEDRIENPDENNINCNIFETNADIKKSIGDNNICKLTSPTSNFCNNIESVKPLKDLQTQIHTDITPVLHINQLEAKSDENISQEINQNSEKICVGNIESETKICLSSANHKYNNQKIISEKDNVNTKTNEIRRNSDKSNDKPTKLFTKKGSLDEKETKKEKSLPKTVVSDEKRKKVGKNSLTKNHNSERDKNHKNTVEISTHEANTVQICDQNPLASIQKNIEPVTHNITDTSKLISIENSTGKKDVNEEITTTSLKLSNINSIQNVKPQTTNTSIHKDAINISDKVGEDLCAEKNLKSQDECGNSQPRLEIQNIPNNNNDEFIKSTKDVIPEDSKTLEKQAPEISKEREQLNTRQPSVKQIIAKPAKPVKEEKALKPLIATPRPLQKKVPQLVRSSCSSETSSGDETSDDDEDEDESTSSEDSGEFFECENQDGRTSTGSNDSGFDSSASTSPAGFHCVRKDCDVNCHRKCEKLTANLCGVNQRLLVEALASRTVSRKEQSTAYGLFRKTGRFTPPARSIPRFRKYTIEDFQFIKVLGKGSFGKVLLAELRDTEYYYAVKCLKKDVVLEDDDVECTLIERKVLALGTNHPYLCHLFATFQTDSHLFFVMEYLNGGDLMFHIQQSGRFPEPRARFYAAEIVSGLKFLHKRGIIYRDLKLDNILLDFDGHVRIADFGMCKLQIYLDKTADTFCGTPDYMAPEIIKGLKYNQAVDWWSFGVLLYEMLIGQSPFSGCDEDELFWSICNEMPSYPRFLSQEALSILTRLLDKDARTRLGGAECMHGDVRDQDFFHSVAWDRLERRDLDAPFKPRVRHPLDTQYFDKTFTGERPRLTAVEPHVLRSMDQEPFRGFSYTNPNATDR